MKKRAVTIPVCGSITVFVRVPEEASEADAISKAHDEQDWRIEAGPNTEPGEFSSLNHLCEGSVCHAPFLDVVVQDE